MPGRAYISWAQRTLSTLAIVHPRVQRRRFWQSRQLQWGLLLLVCVAGCQTTAAPQRLKLGSLLPITGDLSPYGTSMQHAASLLVQTVNGCGGVVGQTVELVATDDQTEPAAGAAAMTKLAEVDRVAGVVGGASSAVASAAVNIAVRNQVVLISPSSTSPSFTDRARQGEFQGFWLRTAPPDTFQGEALAKVAQQRGWRTVSILAVNNDYGNGLLQAFIPAFEASGGRVINKANPVRYPPDSSTFDSIVGAAFQGNPDAVLLIAYPETGSLIFRTAYQQGRLGQKTQILATDGLKEAKIAATIGKNAQGEYIAAGTIGTAPSAGGPGLKAFQDRFTAQFQQAPKIFDANTWDGMALLVLAAEAAKSTQGAAIQEKLREVANPPGEAVTDICQALVRVRAGTAIDYQGASGNVDLNPQGDVTGNYEVWTIAPDGTLQVTGKVAISGR